MIPKIGTVELERIASRGWRGTSTESLGDWLLRAGSGFTGRANSVLPLGSPGCSFDEALAVIDEFYRRHHLAPMFQVPVGPETDALQGDLTDRGWAAFNHTWVLVANLDTAILACPPATGLRPAAFADRPSPEWLVGYVYRGTPLPDSAVAVLENADNVTFCSLADADGQAGVVRGVVTDGWLGVTALTVDETRRRAGVGRHLMGELMRWAAARGARSAYLQVADENVAALRFYDRIGFTRHHGYHYRRAPAG
jgi:ribosomal protein S18 acetylase RimI-like enzyme